MSSKNYSYQGYPAEGKGWWVLDDGFGLWCRKCFKDEEHFPPGDCSEGMERRYGVTPERYSQKRKWTKHTTIPPWAALIRLKGDWNDLWVRKRDERSFREGAE